MDLAIATARVRDAEQLLKLQYLCFQSEAALHGDYSIPPLTQALANLLAEYDTHHILAARLGNELVGSVRGQLIEGTCHIGRLIVHPRLQRHGLGGRLMAAIEAHFGDAERYELFTGQYSEGNLRLYQRLGYTVSREERPSVGVGLVYLEKRRTSG